MREFYITSIHTIFEDNFEIAEGKQVNGYDLKSVIKAPTALEAVQQYITDFLGYEIPEGTTFEPSEDQSNVVNYSVLVDVSNLQATRNDIDRWKKDRLQLYSNQIYIELKELITVMIY